VIDCPFPALRRCLLVGPGSWALLIAASVLAPVAAAAVPDTTALGRLRADGNPIRRVEDRYDLEHGGARSH